MELQDRCRGALTGLFEIGNAAYEALTRYGDSPPRAIPTRWYYRVAELQTNRETMEV